MGETPLLSLLRAGPQLSLVKQLLVARADVNSGDMMGETALMEAACLGDEALSLLLLESRADPEQRRWDGSGWLAHFFLWIGRLRKAIYGLYLMD